MKPYKNYNTKKEKKELKKLAVDEILKQDGKLFKLQKNPFYKKPCKNYDENEPLSKLRRNVKNKELNAKPTKRKLKESTFNEDEPLSKLRRRDVKTKKEMKELRKLTDDEIQLFKLRKNPFYKKPYKNYDENEPLSKLRCNRKKKTNPFYKKPSIAERQKEVLPTQVQLRKLDKKDKSLYKKFPKLVVRKSKKQDKK